MKKFILLLAGAAMLAACDDNMALPPLVLPPTVEVNSTTTVADFKANYWGAVNAPTTIEMDAKGDSVIFVGRVCSSDETGNIYKNIVIQGKDAEGQQVALTFAVNKNDLYTLFPFGQEVGVYATGLSVGGYRGLLQFGSISGDQMTFMAEDLFTEHVVRTGLGLPQPELVDTTACTVAELVAAKASSDELRKWQSRLVRVQGVTFEDAGAPFAGTETTNRYVKDAEGNRLIVRNSSYASFSGEILPAGQGDVVGILSYFGSDWQILLIDANGLYGFTPAEPGNPDTPTTGTPEGEGTLESPYNVAKALEVIAAGPAEAEVYVKGKISKVSEIDTQSYGNATYEISDEGVANVLTIFRGYWLNGAKFTAADQLAAGAEVIVKGVLMSYNNKPEMKQGNQIVSYNGQTGGGDTPPSADGTIFSSLSKDASELPEGWTIDNTTLPEGLTYVWNWKVYNEEGYLNGSAYNQQPYAAEAYAISPVIDLTGATECSMSFEHAAKFQTTVRTLCGVVAREEGKTEWTALTIPEWPEAGAWKFASSGAIDLSAFNGKKIQVAFKYCSSAQGADTWEIRNLIITGKK